MISAELKKILKPESILIIAILSFLLFTSFLYRWIKPFNFEGDSFNTRIDVLRTWIDDYGNSIDETEFREIEANYNDILRQSAAMIADTDYFNEHGINNYEEYLNYAQNAISGNAGYDYGVYSKMRDMLSENTEVSSIYLQEYEAILTEYKSCGVERNHILPYEVITYTNNYFTYLAIWCFVSVFVLAAPVMVNDRASNVVSAQFSSKRGKSIYRIQYITMLATSFVVVSIIIAIGLIAWSKTGTLAFAESNLNSFLNRDIPAVSMTYSDFIKIFIGIIYLLSLGISSIVFFLSARSSHAIEMLLETIPVLVLGCFIALLLQGAFFENNFVFELTKIKYWEVYISIFVLLIGLILNFGGYRFILKHDN